MLARNKIKWHARTNLSHDLQRTFKFSVDQPDCEGIKIADYAKYQHHIIH